MPILRQLSSIEIARGLRAFLRLEAGVLRGEIPDLQQKLETKSRELQQARKRIRQQEERLSGESLRIKPENIIWMFGTARTGSTWLSSIMGDFPRFEVWNEPWVGEIFGSLEYRTNSWEYKRRRKDFVLSRRYKGVYLRSIRNFVLDAVKARFPRTPDGEWLVVKEPHGSMGAPILMEAFPESRMILLVRDPRDVAASGIKAHNEGGWAYERRDKDKVPVAPVNESPLEVARARAKMYLRDVSAAREAFDTHGRLKASLRYEDLRADPVNTMKRLRSALELPINDAELGQAVERHSWENIPEDKKGDDKAFRKASPGSWGEDLTREQIEVIEDVTAPLFEAFYPERER